MELSFISSVPADQLPGTKPVVFLGPSLGTSAHLWDLARTTLDKHFTVVAWNLPGHGESLPATGSLTIESLATAVSQLAKSLGISRYSYAGVSIGGAVGLELARLYPQQLDSVVIVCSAAKIGETAAWAERATYVRSAGTGALLEATPSRWFSPEFIESSPEVVSELLGMLSATSDEDYSKLCEALSVFDARDTLGSITVPTLVISGEVDPVTPPESGKLISESVVNGQQVVIRGASHQAVVERPEEVAHAITEFVSAHAS